VNVDGEYFDWRRVGNDVCHIADLYYILAAFIFNPFAIGLKETIGGIQSNRRLVI